MRRDRQEIILRLIAEGRYSCNPKTGFIISHAFGHTHVMIGNKLPNGYRQYMLRFEDENISVYGHQFVWLYVNGAYDEKKVIDHVDKVRDNNKISNLNCITHAENLKGDWRKRKRKKPCRQVRVPQEQREQIKILSASGLSQVKIGAQLGYSRQTVRKIINE